MEDHEVLNRIEEMVEEERRLHERAEEEGGLSPEERSRLESLQVGLDRAWDYLRQRRALREFGRNPATAGVRPPETVERYEQ